MQLSFADIQKNCLDKLQKGSTDASHPFHQMVLTTHGSEGISACTVVLRVINDLKEAVFFTDIRSTKVGNLTSNNNVTLVFYDSVDKVQLVLKGKAQIHQQDEICDGCWQQLSDNGKKAYMAQPGPSSVIDLPGDGLEYINDDNLQQAFNIGFQNFAVITIAINFMEYLQLNRNGNRRAKFDLVNNSWEGSWLVP